VKKLYLRVYLAVLLSLLVFALAAGLLWRQLGSGGPQSEFAATLAQNALPPATAPVAEQRAGLERLAANLRIDVALFGADFQPLAAVGEPLPVPSRGGWVHDWGGPPAWAVALPDGRWLVARPPAKRRHPAYGLFLTLALLLVAVAVVAYPLVRRLTARLERLQHGVESFGAGKLATRVRVEGHDEVARLAESFNAAAAKIEQLVGAHRTLLANASHELRTPLARIRINLELMQGGVAPEREAQLLQDIAELDQLVGQILLASRLEAASDAGPREEVDLLGLAAEECARYDAQLDGAPVTVRGEPALLRSLLRNLLENARRHGRPPVRVTLAPDGADAVLTVRDEGAGVPEAERERVFEPFYRVAGAADGGSGLGLALVRQIARRHGGDAVCRANGFEVRISR
jgi:signal transduction histidine kinase